MCFQQYWDFEMPQQADEKKNGPDKDITSIMNKPESNKTCILSQKTIIMN